MAETTTTTWCPSWRARCTRSHSADTLNTSYGCPAVFLDHDAHTLAIQPPTLPPARGLSPCTTGKVAIACNALRTLCSAASWVIIATDTGAPWARPTPFLRTD